MKRLRLVRPARVPDLLFPRVCRHALSRLRNRSTFPVCADRVAAARTQLSFPLCPVTLTAMAKKSKKAAPEEEAPKKKGKKKAAAKK